MSTGGPIVVSLVARSFDALSRALELGAADGADVVEFRLDHLAAEVSRDPAPLRALVQRAARPTIAALHGAEGFGTFLGDVRERCDALRAAVRAGVNFIDVDERFAAELGEVSVRCILSSHESVVAEDGLDELDALARRLDDRARAGRDLVKIVPNAAGVAEAFRLLEWLAARPAHSTIAFASGELGSFTRLLAPAYGSALVYAAPRDVAGCELESAAPGQLRAAHMRAVWSEHGPTRATRLAAVVGRPIDHSASPVVHGAACRASGIDAMLVPLAPESLDEVPFAGPRDPSATAESLPRWCGLSVTAPFKLDAVAAADRADPSASAMGASNTLTREDGGRLVAANTDAPAVRVALEAAGARLKGADALVIGAGGAARAAVHALRGAGARVTVAARRPSAAESIGGDASLALDSDAFRALRATVIVHATPLGTGDVGEAPVPIEHLGPGVFVLDAVYHPRVTGLLRRAEAAGATPVTGSSWFLCQAWLQHVRLFGECYRGAGVDPSAAADAARAAMATALDDWLAGRNRP